MNIIKFLLIFTLITTTTHATNETNTTLNNNTQPLQPIFFGTIISVENVRGYQYLNVDENGKNYWIAIAHAHVKKGDTIGYSKQTIMKNFKSKSLDREFKEIIFTSNIYLQKRAEDNLDTNVTATQEVTQEREDDNNTTIEIPKTPPPAPTDKEQNHT